jgi:hypothetical protein
LLLQETGVKFLILATALLAPTFAYAQSAAPAIAPAPAATAPRAKPAAVKPAPAKPAAAAKKGATKPAATSPETMEIAQVIGLRQIDPAIYEIDVRLQDGRQVQLRANAFVMQNLGQLLGTYGK